MVKRWDYFCSSLQPVCGSPLDWQVLLGVDMGGDMETLDDDWAADVSYEWLSGDERNHIVSYMRLVDEFFPSLLLIDPKLYSFPCLSTPTLTMSMSSDSLF